MQNQQKNFISHYKENKIYPVCQRKFFNRKKWESRGQWPRIIYCSDVCRNKKKPKIDPGFFVYSFVENNFCVDIDKKTAAILVIIFI